MTQTLTFKHYFSDPQVHPYDEHQWEHRTASITDDRGAVIFEQHDVEVPKSWSVLATNIVASKYFYGRPGTPERETSVKQLITRVAKTMADWGVEGGYFDQQNAQAFERELTWLLVNQYGAFNSPVWFNCGLYQQYQVGKDSGPGNFFWNPESNKVERADTQYEHPQCSACFIQSVDDDMDSLMDLAKSEAMLFKFGSGSGTDLSTIRSQRERMSGGGSPSGPLSFLRVYDSVASVVKSGGKCLAPHQLVYTTIGPKTVKELADKDEPFYTLSYDPPAGRMKVKKAWAWKEQVQKEVVRITTDKGVFDLSLDHPVRLADGEIRRAGELKAGVSLHAVTVGEGMGYPRLCLQTGDKAKEFIHRLVAQDIMGQDLEGMSVHHKDGDKFNNVPENLEVMTQAKHAGLHAQEGVEKGDHVFQTQTFGQAGEANGMHRDSEFWQDPEKVEVYKQKQGAILKDSGRAADMQARAGNQKMLNTAYRLINAGRDISTYEKYCTARQDVIGPIAGKRKVLKSINDRFGSYDKFLKELSEKNHRVLAVEQLGVMDVYDVEVDCPTPDDKTSESGHNFMIVDCDYLSGAMRGIVVMNTRRAAKMNTLKDWHPDIKEFIEAKQHEERKAWALIDQGYSGDFNGEAYGSVSFQNENLSVRVTDEFMRAVENDEDWTTHWVTDPSVEGPTYKARELMRLIAEGTWVCGDPGLQYEDTVQRWHTCADTEPINSSNPCVTGDTLVTTDRGPTRIDQLVGTQPMVMGMDGKFHQATRVIETGVKPLWEIRTENGYTLRLTPDHPVYEAELQKDVQASRLVAGESVVQIDVAGRLLPDLVHSVEDLGRSEKVYDLTEPTTNHFVANGILVHNCSEYMFLDDTSCNLASLNLTKFADERGKFHPAAFQRAVDVFITAQEIVVDQSSYPTEKIAERSHLYRTLGLGYANLGALIMSNGYSYDSEEGRALAGAITALMHNRAYVQSANIADVVGPFPGYIENRTSMLRVIQQHYNATQALPEVNGVGKIARAAKAAAEDCLVKGVEGVGYRNAQVSVLAPCGTISFLMDCDTTGIEPDIALVKYKLLAGGGMLKLVNKGVPAALKNLGYSAQDIERIVDYIEEQDTIEGAPVLKDEHLSIFDCAFKPRNGVRSLNPMSHLKMMAAAQPFLSGAISKTCNMPQHSTVEDIMEAYIEAWKLGLKAVAIYRDGSKRSQPMSTGKDEEKQEQKVELEPRRRRLPETRQSLTHKFEVGGHEGYLTIGLYPEGNPGEVFITMAKEGSTVGGMMDAFGTAISVGLQYGVPLQTLINKFMHARFEPSGFTKNSEIPMAKSLVDYIFRWLAQTFPEREEPVAEAKPETKQETTEVTEPQRVDRQFDHLMADAPACDTCGSITVRNGSCYKCFNCGNSMGCS